VEVGQVARVGRIQTRPRWVRRCRSSSRWSAFLLLPQPGGTSFRRPTLCHLRVGCGRNQVKCGYVRTGPSGCLPVRPVRCLRQGKHS
jgi:hypothetical protein